MGPVARKIPPRLEDDGAGCIHASMRNRRLGSGRPTMSPVARKIPRSDAGGRTMVLPDVFMLRHGIVGSARGGPL
jgi:hypothetical protein